MQDLLLFVGATTRGKITGYEVPGHHIGAESTYLYDREVKHAAHPFKNDRLFLWGSQGAREKGLFAVARVIAGDEQPTFKPSHDFDAMVRVAIIKTVVPPIRINDLSMPHSKLRNLLEQATGGFLKISRLGIDEVRELEAYL